MGHAVKVVCFTFFVPEGSVFLCYLDDILFGRYDGILWIQHLKKIKTIKYTEVL